MNSIATLTPAQLRQAADIQERIQSLQVELNAILGGGETPTPVATEAPEQPKKKGMSAAGRAAVSAATKARWARIRAEKGGAEVAPKPKRKMSAKGLANIRAGVAKRWAKKNSTTSATVSTTPAEKPKRKMSAAWKKSLALAREARWAKAKKAGK